MTNLDSILNNDREKRQHGTEVWLEQDQRHGDGQDAERQEIIFPIVAVFLKIREIAPEKENHGYFGEFRRLYPE